MYALDIATCEYAIIEVTIAKIPIGKEKDIVPLSMVPSKNISNPTLSIANQMGCRLLDTSLDASDLCDERISMPVMHVSGIGLNQTSSAIVEDTLNDSPGLSGLRSVVGARDESILCTVFLFESTRRSRLVVMRARTPI